jgi:tetratricopeptide (TPR) repeat protein
MEKYSLRAIQSMLGLSRAVVASLIEAGFVTPSRGKRGELRFSFQDVVLLRTAHALQQAKIPSRKILRSLRRLRETLPSELPLTGLRITAVGNEIAVKEGSTQWHVDSGQLLMDFEVRPEHGSVSFFIKPPPPPCADPRAWFDRAVELEANDPDEAETAYREAIAAAPECVDAYLNLGVLLCNLGRPGEAAGLYQQALRHAPKEPLLYFNLAVALEDMGRADEALECYASCLSLSPRFADAHYNAARLHEKMGHASQAIRHYREYRRLQR